MHFSAEVHVITLISTLITVPSIYYSYILKIRQRKRPSFVLFMRYNITANWKNKLTTTVVLVQSTISIHKMHTVCHPFYILKMSLWNSSCSLWTKGLHGSTQFHVTETWSRTHVWPGSNYIVRLRTVCRCDSWPLKTFNVNNCLLPEIC